MSGQRFTLEVRPVIPERLEGLQRLANDLFYSWDRRVRGLFFRLDRNLWDECGHNPIVFLRRVSQERLDQAAYDRNFMAEYNRTLAAYHTYMEESGITESEPLLDPKNDLVVYFCAEFGLHESLPIYSGGLGILAGDYCKAASDLGVPFIGVGILYRRGYFTQSIDGNGQQIAAYNSVATEDLPIRPAVNDEGEEIRVMVRLPGREVQLKVWEVKAGHIRLLLLDSDLPENNEIDRAITFQLYGGGDATRIQQEIVLGIGGVRALRALRLHPTVWHINEGHAAFQILERTRGFVEQGLEFNCAMEMTAVNTVFTTHTPVPAGHDIFPDNLMLEYFSHFLSEMEISESRFLAMGRAEDAHGFNMTSLALRGSRYCNGVSRIHGNVASRMEAHIWPEIPADENPMGYVTNGVHVPTFLAREWTNLFEMQFDSDWRAELLNAEYWERIDDIPDTSFWSVRLLLKRRLIDDIRERTRARAMRNGVSAAHLARVLRPLEKGEDALVIGFARRFATYKRANLLFRDPERLARLLDDPDRRVIIVFAGKAHPSDEPGQQLIRMVHEYSQRPEFFGRLVLIEGYDLALGRKLVSGVDVWLNNPEYPLEACGTSGMKAGINGVLNLSVLDGWWDEGFNGDNGWGIAPDTTAHGEERHNAEAGEILDVLEHEVIPLYFKRGPQGYPAEWIERCKSSMKSLIPRFNAQRMMTDYAQRFYLPATRKFQDLHGNYFAGIQRLAQWKDRVRSEWPKVSASRIDKPLEAIRFGESLSVQVAVRLHSLSAEDVVVECLMGGSNGQAVDAGTCYRLSVASRERASELGLAEDQTLFELDLTPSESGLQHYSLRIYPWHKHLAHPFEMGNMLWI